MVSIRVNSMVWSRFIHQGKRLVVIKVLLQGGTVFHRYILFLFPLNNTIIVLLFESSQLGKGLSYCKRCFLFQQNSWIHAFSYYWFSFSASPLLMPCHLGSLLVLSMAWWTCMLCVIDRSFPNIMFFFYAILQNRRNHHNGHLGTFWQHILAP